MKIAIVMTGLFRTLDRCWGGMRQMFDGHDLNITVVTSEADRVRDYVQIMEPNRVLLIREPDIYQYRQALPRWTDPAHLSALIQAAKALEAAPLVEPATMAHRPDLTCHLRTDLEITTPLEGLDTLDRNAIYLPKFNNWGGYSGQFMIGNPLLVVRHFCRASKILGYNDNPGDETFLKWHMKGWPIKRSRIKFNLLRTSGLREKPNYSTSEDIPEEIKGIPVGHRDEDDVR